MNEERKGESAWSGGDDALFRLRPTSVEAVGPDHSAPSLTNDAVGTTGLHGPAAGPEGCSLFGVWSPVLRSSVSGLPSSPCRFHLMELLGGDRGRHVLAAAYIARVDTARTRAQDLISPTTCAN